MQKRDKGTLWVLGGGLSMFVTGLLSSRVLLVLWILVLGMLVGWVWEKIKVGRVARVEFHGGGFMGFGLSCQQ